MLTYQNGLYRVYIGGYIGIYRVYIGGYTGITKNSMETTIMGYIGAILGLYRDNEK